MAKKDINQLAKSILDIVTGESENTNKNNKIPSSNIIGRSGGLKGGKARADKLSPERRKEIATKAATKRWSK